ncbi:MAG: IBR domain-containing protein [Candidatus Dependentiae bacterium]
MKSSKITVVALILTVLNVSSMFAADYSPSELGQLLKRVTHDNVALSPGARAYLNKFANINASRGSSPRIAALILERAHRANNMTTSRSFPAATTVAPVYQATHVPIVQADVSSLIECSICLEDCRQSEFPQIHCGHNSVCRQCLMRQVGLALKERSTEELKCSTLDCAQEYTLEDIRSITQNNRRSMAQFDDIQMQEYLRKNPGTKFCPTPDCPFAFFVQDEKRESIQCDACHQIYCSQCLYNHGDGIGCEDAKHERELAADPKSADKASQDWVSQNTKSCPGCKAHIQKYEGCNHMTCKKCSLEFCWLCFARYFHDGEGYSRARCRCPLYV